MADLVLTYSSLPLGTTDAAMIAAAMAARAKPGPGACPDYGE